MKDRKIIAEELQNLKEKDHTIFLFHGTGGISKDLSAILDRNEKILCYASAATNSKIELLKPYRSVRTYLIFTDWRILYIQRGKIELLGAFMPKKTVSIPYSSIWSFELKNVDSKLMNLAYSRTLRITTKDGNDAIYHIVDKDVALIGANIIQHYKEAGQTVGEEFDRAPVHHGNYCRYCGASMPPGAKFCVQCGREALDTAEAEQRNVCANCGEKLPENAICCPYCGSTLESTDSNKRLDRPNRTSSRKARERRNAIIALIIGITIALLLLLVGMTVIKAVTSKRNDTENSLKAAQTEKSAEKITEKTAEKPIEKETQPLTEQQMERAAESVKDDTYILSGSAVRVLTSQEVAALSEEQRQMAINEIYARHGRRFNDASIQAYFDTKSWYSGTIAPDDFDSSVFSQIELDNIDLLAGNVSSSYSDNYASDKWPGYYVDYDGSSIEIYSNEDGTYHFILYYPDGTIQWEDAYCTGSEAGIQGSKYFMRDNENGTFSITAGHAFSGNFVKQ